MGLRYGRGLLYMKDRDTQEVFWQGPTMGWDIGGNASRVFTLCYNLHYPDTIFRRFPGVEGSASYLMAGLGVNYQSAEAITLAPIRAGVGPRLGINIGYLAYSRERNIMPFLKPIGRRRCCPLRTASRSSSPTGERGEGRALVRRPYGGRTDREAVR